MNKRTHISQFEQHEKRAAVLAEELDGQASLYNRQIVAAADVLCRAELEHYEYLTASTNTLWRNPQTDNRISVTPTGEILA
ncbi:MAG: hypothetical protein JXB47_12765 [Anaerolineae bacterium]|nr:hypothetical protein [Anaerolineae bacterium]